MDKPHPHLLSAALAAALVGAPQAASAANAQAQATAVIKSGISIRAGNDPAAAPIVQSAQIDWPPPRTVVRPCQPNGPESQAKCRIVLLELQ